MKLLFKEEGFGPDFKKLVGIIDSDLPWLKLKASIIIATDEIIDIIGLPNYESISVENIPDDLQLFFEYVRFAIGFKAYMLFAPTGDVAMTGQGRTMRRDDHQVGAFEWQISNHDESLECFFYKHMNLLMKYMVKKEMIVGLEKYDHAKLIVPNLSDFEKHYGLNDSYFLYLNLLPGLVEFEELELEPRLGDLSRVSLKLNKVLYNYSQKAAVHYAIEWGLRRLDIQMFPKKMIRSTEQSSKTSKSASFIPSELALVFERDSARYLKKLESELTALNAVKTDEEVRLPDLDFDEDDNFVST
ncbi:hypothetical protein [Chryseobacterium caseinilyticum]|uniref:Uncharacterized protein n=1 Tax=Chryseobacterium caseinilyticum TaxID=2771428 RepID=A0ABR8Z880_9FLAO|nr:hypothetical protein [Chryseobacterium caseinilyticum]MBD8081130.1 hypothetical protein [Chryseobacterium caseinilyticum]